MRKEYLNSKKEDLISTIERLLKENQEVFKYITKSGNSVERWFQTELAVALDNDVRFSNVEMEKQYKFDMSCDNTPYRIDNKYKNAFLDLAFRIKGESRETYVGVEIKQRKDLSGIGGIFEDIVKIQAIEDTPENPWRIKAMYFILFYINDQCPVEYSDIWEKLKTKSVLHSDNLHFIPPQPNDKDKNDYNINCLIVYWDRKDWRKVKFIGELYKPMLKLFEDAGIVNKFVKSPPNI